MKKIAGINSQDYIDAFALKISDNDVFEHMVKDEEYVKAGSCLINNRKFFAKKYVNRGIIHTIKNYFRKSKAEKNLKISEYLAASSVLYPTVYGIVKVGTTIKYNAVFLLMASVEDISNDVFYKKFIYCDGDSLIPFITKAAMQIKFMHDVDFFHGDTKRSNFFIIGSPDAYDVGVFDFDGSMICRKISLNQRARDLGRFVVAVIEDQNRFDKNLISSEGVIDLVMGGYDYEGDQSILRCKVIKNSEYHLRRKKML